ncbi:coenzyme Q biosynthesis protein Coq4-domain-containing protein [Blyttiomyces helicus]|uniref:4-hydroxy-3-methoxy-5-polyprenylbenzoate decarboxylase n=1 Tax=Blyttiomyces helicus TaxID=388810 RepID=A0A4P9W3J6_9FUNG|nr:coenzyme Q biosynthesis protein Coq4-domain-containing protein [Blyttiomyces helicus]|eukprot:RKO86889.1 coenzyme Q biosynthesis protein Coq4-domain-containing protein [Blyttiomyces helicus]
MSPSPPQSVVRSLLRARPPTIPLSRSLQTARPRRAALAAPLLDLPHEQPPPHTPRLRLLERAAIAFSSAFGALRDPMRQDLVAALGETTGPPTLIRMRDRMLEHPTGRRILRERPLINSSTVDLAALRRLEDGMFGREYVRFLDAEGVSPDTRTEVKYISDPELAYVMQRYRESHDFFHTLTGIPTTVEAELALKWLELVQTGLPMTLLSSLVGPLRLTAVEREALLVHFAPWAVQCGRRAEFVMNIMYEDHFERRLDDVRREFGFFTCPAEAADAVA